MKKLREWLRDKWRGYTALDMVSLQTKMIRGKTMKSGTIIELTPGEARALQRMAQDRLP